MRLNLGRCVPWARRAEVSDVEDLALEDVAALLQPGIPIHEGRRAETKERMLREAARTRVEVTPGAGSQDEPLQSIHTAEVMLPDGMVRLADVEPISEGRASEVARRVAECRAQRRER